MREIKFRAFDKVNKKMLPVGQLEFFTDGRIIVNEDRPAWHKDSLDIMQFTGLKDKNEVDIYEGDLVKDTNGKIREVKFLNGIFCMCRIGTDFDCLPAHFNYEIIGNIYENPELIDAI